MFTNRHHGEASYSYRVKLVLGIVDDLVNMCRPVLNLNLEPTVLVSKSKERRIFKSRYYYYEYSKVLAYPLKSEVLILINKSPSRRRAFDAPENYLSLL